MVRARLLGGIAVLVAVVVGCYGSGSTSPSSSAAALGDMVTTALPAGFRELGPDQPEEGAQSRAGVAALILRCDAACEDELLGDFDTGYSRHFIRGAVTDDSLVIRVYRFHTSDGAKRYTTVKGQYDFTTIPDYADARLTDDLHPERAPTSDYRTAPFQKLALGRVCNLAVSVFFRSSSDAHSDADVIDLFNHEAALVASQTSC